MKKFLNGVGDKIFSFKYTLDVMYAIFIFAYTLPVVLSLIGIPSDNDRMFTNALTSIWIFNTWMGARERDNLQRKYRAMREDVEEFAQEASEAKLINKHLVDAIKRIDPAILKQHGISVETIS